MTTDRLPWSFRNAAWVLGIVGFIADAEGGKATWAEVVDHFTDDAHEWRTVEKALYDLQVFGVVRRGEERGKKPRYLAMTTLGRAWLEGHLIPIPTSNEDDTP